MAMEKNDHTADKPHIAVSAGILLNAQKQFLLTSRPEGKPHPGYWEFPGGKIEAGETPLAALVRELYEEIGITVTQAHLWLQQHFDYPHAHVTLTFFQVTGWQGDIIAREQQQFAWQTMGHLTVSPILPANVPTLQALAQEYGVYDTTLSTDA